MHHLGHKSDCVTYRISEKKYWFKDSQSRKASDELLDSRFMQIFENKQIVCVEYQDLSEEDEREIFRVRA